MADLQIVYRSPNGDDWMVERGSSNDVIAVVHQANAASGGTRTRTPVAEFLERGGGSPEAVAVRAILAE
ncbi:hypothetical protein [Aureimonas jatrophae]|uniref:Uncharacterized protein n=1 Tax=Aureimonas jatrophae TaxID=1166073 RepID=A0A1H0MK00_9HYPH|nr:hypothetical protein [Aureimonas jatrophae]MBB3952931.1 hypothetical protein [Aureimonas jatrophae]SDO80480.1 hypothetical protein SAMN05192530_11425 [Aureimonas jatrophae]